MTAVAESSPVPAQRVRLDTVEDLIDALAVPASRILLDPLPGAATEADVVRRVDGEPKRLVELVDGTLVEKAVGKRESELAALLISLLVPFVYSRKLGKVYGADLMARMKSRNIRLPDVAYVANPDVPGGKAVDEVVLSTCMTLAIAMISPGNTKKEMAQKRKEYFASGAKVVWQFDMKSRAVSVYSSPDEAIVLREGDTLEGREVLPGFMVNIADLFAQVDRQGP